MGLQDFDHEFLNRHDPATLKDSLKGLLKNAKPVIRHLDIVLDRLEEEPGGVAGIETSIVPLVVQVRNQSVPLHLGEEENRIFGLLEEPSCQEETSEGDERVSTPASHVACREVGQSCAHRGIKVLELH